MKNQKQSINKRRLNQIRRNSYNIRRHRRKIMNLWYDNLFLWIEIFADILGRLCSFLWRYRRIIISIVLAISTVSIIGTFAVLAVFRIRIGTVEEIGYRYGWQSLDMADYNRLMALKNSFLSANPIARWLSGMGSTAWGFILRTLIPGGIVAITYKWFSKLFRKSKRR